MSIRATTFDPARRLDIYLRLKRDGVKKFIFIDENEAAIDISSYQFQLFIKRYEGDIENTVLLTVGSGLTIGGSGDNELTASVTVAQTNIKEGNYYWELYRGSNSKTYLTGDCYLHNGKFDGVPGNVVENNIIVSEEGSPIVIQISDAGSTEGAGDVSGPASSDDDNFASFDGATGKLIKDSGVSLSSLDARFGTHVMTTTDVTNNNAVADTLQDIAPSSGPALSFSALANKRYYFRFMLPFTTANSGSGARFTINANVAIVDLFAEVRFAQTATLYNTRYISTLQGGSQGTTVSPNGNIAIVEGFIMLGSNGTAIGQFSSEVAGSAVVIKAGALLRHLQVTL